MLPPNSKLRDAAYNRFLTKRAQGHSEAAASEAAGLRTRGALLVARRLKLNGGVAAKKSPGRPRKYTAAVCKRAFQLAKRHAAEQPTLTDVLRLLVDEGTLSEPVDRGNFSRHLRQWVHSNRMYINTTSTKTVHMLTKTDRAQRVAACKKMQKTLKDVPLDSIWFVDETTWEECPHNKGLAAPRMSGCDARARVDGRSRRDSSVLSHPVATRCWCGAAGSTRIVHQS
jgi:hypothetical protein